MNRSLVEAARIGYPVMLKSTAGGGGIGMRLVWNETELKMPIKQCLICASQF
jgi:biotin carboxylase